MDEAERPLEPAGPGMAGASAAIVVAAGVGIGVGIVRSKIVAVALGPAGVGAIGNLNLLVATAIVVASAVAGQGVVRAFAAADASEAEAIEATRATGAARAIGGNPSAGVAVRHWLERYVFLGPLLVALALVGAIAVLAGPIATWLTGGEAAPTTMLLVAAAVPIAVLAGSLTSLLQAHLRIPAIGRADVITTLVSLPMTVVLVVGAGLPGGIAAIAVAFLVRLLVLRVVGADVVPRGSWWDGLRPPPGALGPVVRVGAAAAVVGIVGTGGALLVRGLIVGLLGIDASGLYQPVTALTELYLEVLIAAPTVYLLPRITTLLERGDGARATSELGSGLRLALAPIVPLLLLGIGLGGPILSLLYSPDFEPAAPALAIQLAGTLFKVVALVVGAALLPLGATRTWVLITVAVMSLRILGVTVLAPGQGLAGAAVAYGAAWALGAGAICLVVSRSGRVGVERAALVRAAAAGVLVAGSLAGVAVAPAVGGGIAVLAIGAWLVIARAEIRELGAGVGRALRRA